MTDNKGLKYILQMSIDLIWEELVPLNNTGLGKPDSSTGIKESFALAVGCLLCGQETVSHEGPMWGPT